MTPPKATAPVTLGALSKLPTELLSLVIFFLDFQSRARLLQLNSAFYAAAVKAVYAHVRLWHTDLPDLPEIEYDGRGEHIRLVEAYHHSSYTCGRFDRNVNITSGPFQSALFLRG